MANNIQNTSAARVGNSGSPAMAQVYSNLFALAGVPITVDLKPLANQHRIKQIQGVFVDNSAGTTSCSIGTAAAFAMQVPAGYQGILPLYMSDDNVLTINGTGNVGITLLNFPSPAMVWPASPANTSANIVNGILQVQDVGLENLIYQGGLNANGGGLGHADVRKSKRIGNAYSGSITTATTVAVIAGSPSCFVSGISVVLSPDAQIAAGGVLTVAANFTNSGTVFTRRLTMPAAAVFGAYTFFDKENLSLVGAIAGDTFNLVVTSPGGALSAGAIEYTIFGGQTATA